MDPSLKSNEGMGKANRRLGSLMRHITLKDPNQILRYSVVNGDEISDVTSRDDYTCMCFPQSNIFFVSIGCDFVLD